MELKTVYFVSLGCPKNLVDSQVMLGKLAGKSQLVQSPEEAQIIIVNTCSFIEAAKKESVDTILEMAEYKDHGRCEVLVISGCLAQRYSQELQKELPEVDLIIGTGQYHRILEFLEEGASYWEQGQALPSRVYVDQPAFIHTEDDTRVQTGQSFSAYLKLSEGCNRRCSFCIIPKLRGNVRSRSIQSLVDEATQMAQNGVRELNLVAQDLTEYGMEGRYKERLELLLPELCKVPGIEWIRLHYVYPDQFSDELIEIIAREPKIVKYLDMPIQHTQDRLLKLMNRRLTREKLFTLIGKLRAKVPGLVFRTSIIVGFPGETEAEYEALCRDLVELDLDYVGVFHYSKEEGTKAADLPGHLDGREKRRRKENLNSLLGQAAQERQEGYVGKTLSVLVEGPSEETDLLLQGRLSTHGEGIDGHVLINDVEDLGRLPKPGDFVQVEITQALPQDLLGRAVSFSQGLDARP